MLFSKKIENFMINSFKRIVFIIGGAYGFSDKVYSMADEKVSLSKMTYNHQMIRVFFYEQLYRAFTIIKNEKYKDDYSALDDCSSHEWGTTFSKSYVRHLFNINEILGLRIASTMNLTFYNDLMVEIRRNINEKSFGDWSDSMLSKMNQMKGM